MRNADLITELLRIQSVLLITRCSSRGRLERGKGKGKAVRHGWRDGGKVVVWAALARFPPQIHTCIALDLHIDMLLTCSSTNQRKPTLHTTASVQTSLQRPHPHHVLDKQANVLTQISEDKCPWQDAL